MKFLIVALLIPLTGCSWGYRSRKFDSPKYKVVEATSKILNAKPAMESKKQTTFGAKSLSSPEALLRGAPHGVPNVKNPFRVYDVYIKINTAVPLFSISLL